MNRPVRNEIWKTKTKLTMIHLIQIRLIPRFIQMRRSHLIRKLHLILLLSDMLIYKLIVELQSIKVMQYFMTS